MAMASRPTLPPPTAGDKAWHRFVAEHFTDGPPLRATVERNQPADRVCNYFATQPYGRACQHNTCAQCQPKEG